MPTYWSITDRVMILLPNSILLSSNVSLRRPRYLFFELEIIKVFCKGPKSGNIGATMAAGILGQQGIEGMYGCTLLRMVRSVLSLYHLMRT